MNMEERVVELPKGFKVTADYIAQDMIDFFLSDKEDQQMSLPTKILYEKVLKILQADRRLQITPDAENLTIKIKFIN